MLGPMNGLPASTALKVDLLFTGLRYSPSLSEAMGHAFPNFYPYRFGEGEADPTGVGQTPIPYLLDLEDGTLVRIKGDRESPYRVSGSLAEGGYRLLHDQGGEWPITFEPAPAWLSRSCSDEQPMNQLGIGLHGDMLVVNVAPACQFFVAPKVDGRAMRCVFCLYGRPDARSEKLGQRIDDPLLPATTLRRMQEVINAALAEGGIRHVYLVAGCMLDWEDEARRYLQLARAVRTGCPDVPYLACGSGALPPHALRELHREGLVDGVCFNLEVHGAELFGRICPGKAHHVGYARWLASLEQAVGLWGAGHVYSAMVAGVELEPQYGGLSPDAAVDHTLHGANDLICRGILPIYSLYWPLYGKDYHRTLQASRTYFVQINLGYRQLRREHRLPFHDGFMCHRCSYMQLECDLDRHG